MKINSSTTVQTIDRLAGQSARVAPSQAKAAAARGDSVAINPLASQMASLEQAVSAEPGFDAAKVEAIKQAISNGEFKINPAAIADGLIASTRDLLSAQPRA